MSMRKLSNKGILILLFNFFFLPRCYRSLVLSVSPHTWRVTHRYLVATAVNRLSSVGKKYYVLCVLIYARKNFTQASMVQSEKYGK